LNDFEII
jgi:hypothetical protein